MGCFVDIYVLSTENHHPTYNFIETSIKVILCDYDKSGAY